jgi:hypothetical protein
MIYHKKFNPTGELIQAVEQYLGRKHKYMKKYDAHDIVNQGINMADFY